MIVNKTNFGIEHFKNSISVIHPENIDRPLDEKHFKGMHLDLERDNHLKESLKQVKLEGEILEFGVFKAHSTNIIADTFKDKTIHGFDSFEGLPEDWAVLNSEVHNPQNLKRKKGYFALEELPEVRSNVRLWKGWFDDTTPKYIEEIKPQQIAFLHIDGDLHSSARSNLYTLEKFIVKDTIICFDELYPFGRKRYDTWEEGEFKALKEWTHDFNREFEVLSHNLHQQSTIRIVK